MLHEATNLALCARKSLRSETMRTSSKQACCMRWTTCSTECGSIMTSISSELECSPCSLRCATLFRLIVAGKMQHLSFAPDVSEFLCRPKKAPPSLLRLLMVQRIKRKQNSTCLPAKHGFISA